MSHISEWDEVTRGLIVAEIRLGLTFARLAETHYAYRKWAAGDDAYARAVEAWTNAERRLDAAEEQNRTFGDLREKLGAVRRALAQVERDEQAA